MKQLFIKQLFKKQVCILLYLTLVLMAPVNAGSQNKKNANFSPDALSGFAKGVEKIAAKEGARAFIIARIGRPEKDLPKGISFTHTAVAIYSNITTDSGDIVRGYAVYNLYQDSKDPGLSHLIQDYPVDFYAGAATLKAGIIVPDINIQLALVDLINSGDYKKLHNPAYSVIANPHNDRRQNCTEFTLDMVNAAIYHTTDVKRLKINAKNWFEPQPVTMSRFKLSLGGLFSSGVTTRDHDGKIKTATFMSIARYLQQNELLVAAYQVSENLTVEDLIVDGKTVSRLPI